MYSGITSGRVLSGELLYLFLYLCVYIKDMYSIDLLVNEVQNIQQMRIIYFTIKQKESSHKIEHHHTVMKEYFCN